MRKFPGMAALVLAAAAAAPASADAYVIGGSAWPEGTVRYYTAARGYATPVNRAARIWNGARVGLRFVRSSRARADVVISYGGPRCGGAAPVGYGRGFRGSWVQLGAGCSTQLITLTAVHELGHVLGLDHEDGRCARMNPGFDTSGSPSSCSHHSLAYWLARPLTADDIRGARAVYRGGGTSEPEPEDDRGGWRW